jgi:hypothetical protein
LISDVHVPALRITSLDARHLWSLLGPSLSGPGAYVPLLVRVTEEHLRRAPADLLRSGDGQLVDYDCFSRLRGEQARDPGTIRTCN